MGDSVDFAFGERRALDGTELVEFVGDRGGKVLRFWITKEALEHLAGAKSHSLTLLSLFDAWKEKVWQLAEAKCAKVRDDQEG